MALLVRLWAITGVQDAFRMDAPMAGKVNSGIQVAPIPTTVAFNILAFLLISMYTT